MAIQDDILFAWRQDSEGFPIHRFTPDIEYRQVNIGRPHQIEFDPGRSVERVWIVDDLIMVGRTIWGRSGFDADNTVHQPGSETDRPRMVGFLH
ncbi:MAG TPA: hypothetical protein PKN04_16655, partial [bacterium]|nr:hypothetical protein [bacterium]